MTENAVTEGSFTVFTEPAVPKPESVFNLVILVNLPDTIDFDVNDISGKLTGSDGYVQSFANGKTIVEQFNSGQGVKKTTFNNESEMQFERKDKMTRIHFQVQSGETLIKDQVSVSSKVLNESQILEIEYQ